MAKLKAPEGATSAGFDGETFEVVNGIITVPHEAVAALIPHGYEPIGQTDEQDDVVEQKAASKKAKKDDKPAGEAAE